MDTALYQTPADRNFEVEVRYLGMKQATSDFSVLAANVVLHIHTSYGPGDILVFLPGGADVIRASRMIQKRSQDLDIIPLTMHNGEQTRASILSGQNRKCILATSVAESTTIDNVGYVVDAGLSKRMIYNPRLDLHMLQLRQISQESANQRRECAGRKGNGICYRLYSEEAYDNMPPSTTPSTSSSSIHVKVLKLLDAGERNIADLEGSEAFHPEVLARAAQDLLNWGQIKSSGQITRSGKLAARCPPPLKPIWVRALEVAESLGCSMIMLEIAVLCSISKSILTSMSRYREVADKSQQAIAAYPSDHLTLVNAFDLYLRVRNMHEKDPTFNLRNWCKLHFMDYAALEEAYKTRAAMKPFLKRTAKIAPTRGSTTDNTIVQKALAIALCTQAAICLGHQSGEYRTVHENVPALLAPESSLLLGSYEWIVYSDLKMFGDKIYMGLATVVDVEWLVDLPYFQHLPLKGNGLVRQDKVKKSLDAAKARIDASKAN